MARKKNILNWEAYSSKERNSVIESIKDVISQNDGYIINFKFYSDLAMSMTVEIESQNILKLFNQLSEIIRISESEPILVKSVSIQDWWILINISFSAGKGNLKMEVPNVPG